MVGYSKMLIDEQHENLDILNDIIRDTEAFRAAEAANKLIRLPSGDGMALAFLTRPDAPLQCAIQVSKALKAYPHLQVRMGVHSGPVGAGERRERHGGGGRHRNQHGATRDGLRRWRTHSALTARRGRPRARFAQWQPHIHELGEIEVKHGVVLSLFNFYSEEFGNPAAPEKLARRRQRANRGARSVSMGPEDRAVPRAGTLADRSCGLDLVATGKNSHAKNRAPIDRSARQECRCSSFRQSERRQAKRLFRRRRAG